LSSKDENIPDTSFAALVISLSSTAWIGLGKLEDPVSGGVKMDLRAAKYTIDILLMLRAKTEGNLDPEEKMLLDEVIADLQANYAETVFTAKESTEAERGEPPSEGGQPEPEEKKE
jgi:hypothetical protein